MASQDSPISHAAPLKEGYMLNNSYVIERKIGSGGFGITYKAKEIASGRTVVIKENFPAGCVYRDTTNGETVQPYPDKVELFNWSMGNFWKEVATLIELPYHPNVVRVLAAFYANNTGYIVMKQVKGINLHKLYPEHSNIPRKFLLPFINSMLEALAHLHKNGVIHRDIKPENIIITPDGSPVLIDFGAARISSENRKATQIGTFGYAPPEQISTTCYNEFPQPHIDLYALGATCYRLITGRDPMYNTDLLKANKIARRQYPRYVLATIDKAREAEPLKRWQSAAEWQTELVDAEKRVNPFVSALSMIFTFAFVLFLPLILKKCDGGKQDNDSSQPRIERPALPDIELPIEPLKPIKKSPKPIKKSPKPIVEPPVETEPADVAVERPVHEEPILEETDFKELELVSAVQSEPVETPEPSCTVYDITLPVPEPEIQSNIDGVSQPSIVVKAPPALPVTELLLNEDSKFYTIKLGDTLARIARKHKITVQRLMQLNNMTNADASKIRIGDRLRVAE